MPEFLEQTGIKLVNDWTDSSDKPSITKAYADLFARRHIGKEDPDAFQSFDFLADKYGFTSEEHHVTTKDGYKLMMHRIPGMKNEAMGDGPKPAVLLVHALASSSFQWIFNDPEVAPAFVLARAGYDVWLANNRGNMFSLGHEKLDAKKDRSYWYFTWEEMGTFDVPAMIDHITDTTGVESVSYIGHSEGCSQFLAGAALMPDYYNAKVNLANMLAPPAAMKYNPNTSMKMLSYKPVMEVIEWVANGINQLDWVPHRVIVSEVGIAMCGLFDGKICDSALSFMDYDPTIDNLDRIDVYLSKMPVDSGAFNYAHYGQLMHLDDPDFQRFDLGTADKNMARYNQTTPPSYDLAAIKMPMTIFSGSQDSLADQKDVAWTKEQLKHTTVFAQEYYMGHASFSIAKEMSWFTVDLMSVLKKYNPVSQASDDAFMQV